jgi:hypothetical protein
MNWIQLGVETRAFFLRGFLAGFAVGTAVASVAAAVPVGSGKHK